MTKNDDENMLANLSPEVRRHIAMSKNTLPATLAFLATDTYLDVKRAVALNDKTPIESLKLLVLDKDGVVVESVADNINSTPEMLDDISKLPFRYARVAVAQKERSLPSTLLRLSRDKFDDVQNAALSNPRCPKIRHVVKKCKEMLF
jgi:hypothetical protein